MKNRIFYTCCFIGHRFIENKEKVFAYLYQLLENLIINDNYGIFLLGSKSDFNQIAFDVLKDLKQIYPFIKIVYIRAEYPYHDDFFINVYLKEYDSSYLPKKIENAGKSCYIQRNKIMIEKSDLCIFYYNENYIPTPTSKSQISRNSGTKKAYEYATKLNKKIFNLYPNIN